MIFNVSGSGGGAALNFRVVGGTTAPENPKENCIWVNTSTDITSYVFSATQPTGSAGMVWIITGTSSPVEFNALKKNGLQVYPIFAKQYVSGEWVRKDAQTWDGTEWNTWRIYLFDGNVNTELTGGINGTIQDNAIFWHDTVSGGENMTYTTMQAVDVTDFKTLSVRMMATLSSEYAYMRIGLMSSTSNGSNKGTSTALVYAELDSPFNSEEKILSVDISDITGEVYPFYAWGATSSAGGRKFIGYIYEWWAEL